MGSAGPHVFHRFSSIAAGIAAAAASRASGFEKVDVQ
jgi:hypothetical protein